MAKTPWWDAVELPKVDSDFYLNWIKVALINEVLRGATGPVSRFGRTGFLKEGDTAKSLVKRLETDFPEFRILQRDESNNQPDWTYVTPDMGLFVSFDGDERLNLTVFSRNPELLEKVRIWWRENTNKKGDKGRVSVVVATKNGPEFRSMGVAGEALVRENYSPWVLEGYDRIVRDLNSAKPSGRVAILDGKPGTGKTFIIRGLLNEVPGSRMVIVPANLVVQLASPNMIPALIDLHKQAADQPIVFLIEDADECLAPRMGDNMSAVSAILNLGDGILGQLLDIRIVATTNAHRQELDEAIMRPGRLSANVHVGALTHEQSQAILDRLIPGKKLQPGQYTLAEIYRHARDDGWEPPAKAKKMGFVVHDEDGYEDGEVEPDELEPV